MSSLFQSLLDALALLHTRRLQLKFRTIPSSAATLIAHASPEQLDRWVERILTAASIEDVFANE